MDNENNRRALDLGPRLVHELPLGRAVVSADLRLAPCVVGLGRGLFLVLFSAGTLGTGLRLAFRLSLRLAFFTLGFPLAPVICGLVGLRLAAKSLWE